MTFLVDESLSQRVSRLMTDAGHDAVHVGDLDLLGARDLDVMAAAREAGRTVVSADTDFGELLAIGRHPGPSVILLRRAPHHPDEQAELLLEALDAVGPDLDAGAVVLSRGRARVRRSPNRRSGMVSAFWRADPLGIVCLRRTVIAAAHQRCTRSAD